MHIAICDDNVADRKQLERLLSRLGMSFVDSYGSASALLSNPRQYGLFFIDMNTPEDLSAREIVEKLLHEGVNVPIVLCCSKINYRIQSLPDNLLYLDKPIKSSELADMIEDAKRLLKKLPTALEIRCQKETVFLYEEEIISFEKDGNQILVNATDNRTFRTQEGGSLENFYYSQFENRTSFFVLNKTTVINTMHLKEVSFSKVVMDNGLVYHHFNKRSKLQCYLSK